MVTRHVEESEDNLPVIDRLITADTKVVKADNGDRFAKDARDLKGMAGLDKIAKRRISNQITKFQRNADNTAGTKQIQEKSFITGYNAFEVVEPPYNLDYLTKLYELSAPHYSAVNAKVANIVGLGYKFVETRKTKRNLEDIADNEAKLKKVRRQLEEHKDGLLDQIEQFNSEDTFTEVLVKVWRDYETTGNGYIEIGRKKDGSIGYFGHIPAQTIRIRRQRDGFVQMSGFKIQFFAPFGEKDLTNPIGADKPNEIIHLKKYSPTSGYYGIPDIVAAKQAIAGNEFAARFNLDYFENKAVPRHVIILKGAKLGNQAEQALLQFFETGLKGQNHRSLYIPLPGDSADNKVELKIEAVEAGIQDASFTHYRAANLSDILMAHRVPLTKVSVSEGASLALAKDADKTFKEQVCAPEQRILNIKLNKIFKELTDAFELKLEEMTLTDEDTQSQIDERNVKAGIDLPNEVRARKGLPSVKGGNERVDLNAKDKISQAQSEATTIRQRDSVRSAGQTDGAGAARNPKGEGRATP